MNFSIHSRRIGVLAVIVLACASGGCRRAWLLPPAPPPLGYTTDPIWQTQEANAEASDFVVYEHEFEERQGIRLNEDGEDHVKEIAARISKGQNFPVIVQRSRSSIDESTEYHYPVHFNPELDLKRRELIVQSLVAMGIEDADQRVVVAPALTPGYQDFEAERAYGLLGRQNTFGFGLFGGWGGFRGFGGLGF